MTGTRIVRDGYTAPTPVTVARVDDLLAQTPTLVSDGLNKLPQFQMSESPAKGLHNWPNEDSHGNLLNLRALGSGATGTLRTLILLDGVRMAPTNYPGSVDVDVIPSMFLDRVEVVTGGASAAYGSDAVAGVVNFIIDKKFEGIKSAVQGGMADAGDNRNNRESIGVGFKFGAAGHGEFGFEHYSNNGMLRSDRAVTKQGWIYAGANTACVGTAAQCTPGGPLNPLTLTPNGRLTGATTLGLIERITAAPPAGYQYVGAGFPYLGYEFLSGSTIAPFNSGAKTGTPGFASGGNGFGIPFDVTSVAPNKTNNFFARGDYEFAPAVSGYAQGIYSRDEESYTSQSNGWVTSPYAPIFSGNPYLPAAVQAAMGPNDILPVGAYHSESIKPDTNEKTDFWMGSAGLNGKLGGSWTWRADYDHGQTKHAMDQANQYYWARAYAALDAVRDPATGNIVCRATIDPDPAVRAAFTGCQPMNILGVDPAVATPAGYAYATGTSSYRATFKQDALSVSVSGSPFEVPAGPVDIAGGAEYRHASLVMTSNGDPSLLATPALRQARYFGDRGVSAAALTQNFWLTNIGTADGSEHVTEEFAEINVPLLKDLPGVRKLDLNGAVRFTDYSVSGSVHTWKGGLQWRPVNDLLVRGTASSDIRAPELFDLFKGDQFSIGLVLDPVTGINANIPQITGASPNLKPEMAKTYTGGFVFTPSEMLQGFSVAADYYSIKINGAFGTLNATQVITNCYTKGPSAPECAQITRPAPNAFPTSIRLVQSNMSFLKTSGIDIDASYRTDLGRGKLVAQVYANHLLSYETQLNSSSPVLDYKGIDQVTTSISEGRPRWSANTNVKYDINGTGILLGERYISAMTIARPGLPSNFVNNHAPDIFYTDLTLTHDFMGYNANFQGFVSVNNLFGRDAPLIPSTVPGSSYPTIIGVYDYVGRSYVLGLRVRY